MDFVKSTIRPATPADTPAIARLSGQLGYPLDENTVRGRIAMLLPKQDHLVFVAEKGGDLAGFAHVGLKDQLVANRQAELLGLVVDEAHRGCGLGGRLLHACEAWTAGRGCPLLVIRSGSQRTEAHGFYQRRGYELVKEQKVFVITLPLDTDAASKPAVPCIRPMQEEEEGIVRDLIRREFLLHVASSFTGEGIGRFLSDLNDTFASLGADEHVLTAHRDRVLMGVLIYREPSHLRYFFVDNAHQRQGVGRALFAEAISQMRACAAGTVTVNAAVNAVDGYRKMGFSPTAQEQCVNGFRFVPMEMNLD